MNATAPPIDEIDLLLPWYATGTLSADETARVEAALARDPGLAERLALTREEMDEAISETEAMPAPGRRVRDSVLDRIAAMEESRPLGFMSGRTTEGGFLAKVFDFVAGLAPRTIAFAGTAAALLVLVQAGVIGTMVAERPAVYGTASGDKGAMDEGTFALVTFAPQAGMARISAVLTELGASIVDGPRAGGFYRIRVAAKAVATDERDRLIARLRERTDVIAIATPSQ